MNTTSIPSAADLGIVSGGTLDQSGLINSALSNPKYAGILFDFSPPSEVYVSSNVDGQGKVLRFAPGTYISGPLTSTTPIASVSHFVLDCGYKQQCFDPACGLQFNPIGTTLGKISPWAFGAKSDNSDAAKAIQLTIDLVIRNPGVQTVYIPAGTYVCNSPLICAKPGSTNYTFFQISIEGETNFWAASGFGTVLDFSGFNDRFGIGLHQAKGASIRHLMLNGAWTYTVPSAYEFYNTSLSSFTDGVCRDSRYSPYAGIVVDPFGPSLPSDGGYPGLSSYYFGSNDGSTGVTLEDVFITNFVIGFISSPNGQTVNAELIRAEKIQFASMKVCIAGCQTQEKMNVFRHVGCWGTCHTIFLAGNNPEVAYGLNQPGTWYVEDVNIAGNNNQFVWNDQQGYFPSFFKNIYAELLGKFGHIYSPLGTTVSSSIFNFATYEEAGSYMSQIEGRGVAFIGCNFRMYGTYRPVTVNSGDGGPVFDSCAFDTVPFFNIGGLRGDSTFLNCTVHDAGIIIGPSAMQNVSLFTDTFAYGNNTITAFGIPYTFASGSPALPMPINRTTDTYLINPSPVILPSPTSKYFQATVTCSGDELNRVLVGDVIVGWSTNDPRLFQAMGIVSAVGSGNFTIDYIPAFVTSEKRYYLFIWLPLYNISFTGNTTIGSDQITNVAVIAGDMKTFIGRGGLLSTTSVTSTDAWPSKLIRLTSYDSSTATLTFDKIATASATKNLFTNTNAVPAAQIPAIAAGEGAGHSPTLAITKGNDQNMQVSITTGTSPVASAVVATIGFGIPFVGGYIPSPRFSAANAAAAALSGRSQVFMDAASSSEFTITASTAALATATSYLWNVEVR